MNDCGLIVEISQTNTNSETHDGFNKQRRKKHKHKLAEENMPDTIIKESYKASHSIAQQKSMENKKHTRKKENSLKKKVTDFEIMESATLEQSDNNAYSNKYHKKKKKHKRKRHEFLTAQNLQKTADMELNHEDLEESIVKNSDVHNVSDSRRKGNRPSETKTENCLKKIYNSINDLNEFDCEIVEPAVTKNSDNDENSIKIPKKKRKHEVTDDENSSKIPEKKRKHEVTDDENASECRILETVLQESEKDNIKFLKSLRKQERKKAKSKLKLGEAENIFNHLESATDEYGENGTLDVLEVHKREDRHKQTEVDKISKCKDAESIATEINQNDFNRENIDRSVKKKKHKSKLPDKMENTSDSENINKIHEKEKKKHKQDLLNVIENISDCETANSNTMEINKNEKKKKKHKRKLHDEIENTSDYETADSNPFETNRSDCNGIHKKRKKEHKLILHSEMQNTCNDNIQESAIDQAELEIIFDTSHVQKRNKCESSNLDEISEKKNIEPTAFEINQNDFSAETLNQLYKPKKKNLGQNLGGIKITDNLQEKEKNVSCKGPEKNYEKDAWVSFDPFIHDFADIPVSFPVPLLHEGETVRSITSERREYLERNGVTIQTGKWTKNEDDILTRNFLQFGFKFGVNDPFQLLGINQTKRECELEKFKKAKHFLIRLGKDLDNRSLRSIYMRARKLLTPLKIAEKLSEKDTDDLKFAHQLVGNKWTKISEMLNISDDTCHTAYRWHKRDVKKGKWTPEEDSNLIRAIKTVSGEEDISANNLKNISWKAVAEYVSTRNEFQCHKRWAEHFAWDSSVSEKKCWKRYHFGKLIYLLKEKYCFNSENEIDWRELHKHFNDVAPSYIFLHKKWFYLKGRLPKGFGFSYSRCLDTLKKIYKDVYEIYPDEKLWEKM